MLAFRKLLLPLCNRLFTTNTQPSLANYCNVKITQAKPAKIDVPEPPKFKEMPNKGNIKPGPDNSFDLGISMKRGPFSKKLLTLHE